LHRNIKTVKAPKSALSYNPTMYIVAIAWIYVTLLMAVTETNITAAILTFCLYGLAPLALILWLFGTPHRRRLARRRAANTALPNSMTGAVAPVPDRHIGEPDRGDTKTDQ
jgi:hypothetical protein